MANVLMLGYIEKRPLLQRKKVVGEWCLDRPRFRLPGRVCNKSCFLCFHSVDAVLLLESHVVLETIHTLGMSAAVDVQGLLSDQFSDNLHSKSPQAESSREKLCDARSMQNVISLASLAVACMYCSRHRHISAHLTAQKFSACGRQVRFVLQGQRSHIRGSASDDDDLLPIRNNQAYACASL